MSILRNLLGNFMPHPESRSASGTLNALNSEVVLDLNGDNSVTIFLNSTNALSATYVVEVSPDGTNYYSAMAYPYTPGCVLGTIPLAAQPIVSEASTLQIIRTLCVAVGGMKKVRIRLSAWSSGQAAAQIIADTCDSISPFVRDQKGATLFVTNTAAVSTGVTATLAAVAGLRHYINRISVVRSATAALTASATPVLVTTTNIPGSPVLTFGSDAAGIGVDKELVLDFGDSGIAATAINTSTTVVAPVYTGVIWRINVSYRLGL